MEWPQVSIGLQLFKMMLSPSNGEGGKLSTCRIECLHAPVLPLKTIHPSFSSERAIFHYKTSTTESRLYKDTPAEVNISNTFAEVVQKKWINSNVASAYQSRQQRQPTFT